VNTVRIPVNVTSLVVATVSAVNPASLTRGASDTTVTVTGTGFTSASRVEVNGFQVQTTFVDSQTLKAVLPSYLLSNDGSLTLSVITAAGRSNTVAVAVGVSAPMLTGESVRHGASNELGGIAPGEIVTISGTQFGPANLVNAAPVNGFYGTSLSGVSVLFDDVAAPVLWAMQGRIAVVAPYSLSGKASTRITVDVNGSRSQPVVVPVQAANPGLFTANSTGRGQVLAVNSSTGSMNGAASPAERGSFLTLYGTGEGLSNPTLATGQVVPADNLPRPVLPVFVSFGDVRVQAEYAGGAPGLVGGLLQVNVRVPENAPTGDNVAVTLHVGDFSSPAGVTASVR
jgi:uncharacterized protein (TIGR03437 family)